MSHLERVASILGVILIGTAAYLIISDRQGSEARSTRNRDKRGEQDQPVEELTEKLKQAWSGYHNR